jgi:gliding motility-associated-like protein
LFFGSGIAQTTYKMSNLTVYDCKGKLTDSEGNKVNAGWYASSEDIIFTICVSGASRINISFTGAFNIEANADFLKVYNGKDTNATLIKKFDNNNKPSGSFAGSDSCITFYFHSDKYVNGEGFELSWDADITQITQPKFSAIADPKCNSKTIRVTLDQNFNCDSIKPRNFKLSGTLSTAISSVTGINCNAKNLTNVFDVTFASGLNQSGNYILDFKTTFTDKCDSVWTIQAQLNFKISDCPIVVILKGSSDSICLGFCDTLTATITGGNPAKYVYTWLSGGITGKPTKIVCPTTTTRYILQVSDGISIPGSDTFDVHVITPPKAQNDTTVCQSSAPFALKSSPPGGLWSGTGISNAQAGLFDPAISGKGSFTVYYTKGKCYDAVIVNVTGISAGPTEAACPNSSPFMASGFSPAGGTWSGPNINSSGLITPPGSNGSFTVTYTWNGCAANKVINIGGINIAQADTLCQSVTVDTLKFSPVGGVWRGQGFSNTSLGINHPSSIGAGTFNYIYTINGCVDTLKRTVQGVDARWDEIACPDAGQVTLPLGLPAGGYWTGKGIFDKNKGIFDADTFRVPTKVTFAYSILTYHSPNGCTDDKIMYLRYTRFYTDTVRNCVSDTNYYLRWQFVNNDPWDMMFTGSSAIVGNSLYYQQFSPKLAGSGTIHQIIGEAHGCKDTLIIKVYPRANIQKDTVFCIADDPFTLYNGEGKGTFIGSGITNGAKGIFNPSLAGQGNHTILFNLPGKCTDTIHIFVKALPVVTLSGLKSFYCFKDTVQNLILNPAGGTLNGTGLNGNTFNPAKAGTGTHTLSYTFGSGKCISTAKANITVGDTLKLNLFADKDSVCIGTTVTLGTKAMGGNGKYILSWSSGQGNAPSIFVNNKTTTSYRVTLNDGCSDSAFAIKEVYIHPILTSTSTTSPIQCYGSAGFVNLKMSTSGPFKYQWNTQPVQNTATITAPAGNTYKVHVVDLKSGCLYDTSVAIPGYPAIRAYFTYAPNGQCLMSYDAQLQLINLSQGGTKGFWDLGDSTIIPYDPGVNPGHLYDGLMDYYWVKLKISNAGGCTDSFMQKICVKEITDIVLPNSFSPNGDGINDIFKVQYASFLWSELSIYTRWGERVFYSTDYKQGWDGYYQGKLCPTEYYIYTFKYKGKKTPTKLVKGVLYLIR